MAERVHLQIDDYVEGASAQANEDASFIITFKIAASENFGGASFVVRDADRACLSDWRALAEGKEGARAVITWDEGVGMISCTNGMYEFSGEPEDSQVTCCWRAPVAYFQEEFKTAIDSVESKGLLTIRPSCSSAQYPKSWFDGPKDVE